MLFLLILASIAFSSLEVVVAKPSFAEKMEKKGASESRLKKRNKRATRKKKNVKPNTPLFESIGKRRKKNPKARGLILKFHSWPNASQSRLILKELKKTGLKKTKTIDDFQMWVFEWRSGNLKSSRRAQRACKRLPKIPAILSYCEPNSLLPVNDSGDKKSFVRGLKRIDSGTKAKRGLKRIDSDDKAKRGLERIDSDDKAKRGLERIDSGAKAKRGLGIIDPDDETTEAGFNVDCPYCKENSAYDLIQSIAKNLNVRNCGLISDSRDLMKENKNGAAKLSDYWAQEMIGG